MATVEDVLIEFKGEIGELKKAVGNSKKLLRSFSRDAGKQGKEASRAFNDGVKNFGKALVASSVILTAALGKSTQSAVKFEASMRDVNSIAKLNEKDFKALNKQVLALTSQSGLADGPEALAAALYDINSAGFQAQDGIKILEISSKAASAGLTEAKTAADGITTALNSYGKGSESAAKFADILFKTVEKGKTTFGELSPNIGKVTSLASTAGVSFEELSAGLALLTARGVSTEEATTGLKASITAILKPGAEAAKLANELGIELGESALKTKGLSGVFADIAEKTGGSTDQIIKLLPNVRALAAASALIGKDQAKGFVETTASFGKSAGALADALAQQEKSVSLSIKKLKANFEAAVISIGNRFLPVLRSVTEGISFLVKEFNGLSEGQKDFIALGSAAAAAFAGLVGGAALLAAGIGAVSSGIASFAALFGAGGLLAGAGATIAAIGIPVVALTGSVTALGIAWSKNLGNIRENARSATSYISGRFTGMLDDINEALRVSGFLAYFNSAIAETRENFEKLFRADLPAIVQVSSTALIGYTKTWIDFSTDALKTYLKALSSSIKATSLIIEGEIGEAYKEVGRGLLTLGSDTKRTFSEVAKNIKESSEDVSESWEIAEERHAQVTKEIADENRQTYRSFTSDVSVLSMGMVDGINGNIKSIDGSFKTFTENAFENFKSLFSGIRSESASAFDAILAKFKSTFGPITRSLNSLSDSVKGIFGSIGGGLKSVGSGLSSSVEGFKAQTQSNSVSCGQCAVADTVNHLTGQNLTDRDISDQFGFGLKTALRENGIDFRDRDLNRSSQGEIESALAKGLPVIIGLNGEEFSPSGFGHIVTLIEDLGDSFRFADPATGTFRTATKERIFNAPQRSDGLGNFALIPQGEADPKKVAKAAARFQDQEFEKRTEILEERKKASEEEAEKQRELAEAADTLANRLKARAERGDLNFEVDEAREALGDSGLSFSDRPGFEEARRQGIISGGQDDRSLLPGQLSQEDLDKAEEQRDSFIAEDIQTRLEAATLATDLLREQGEISDLESLERKRQAINDELALVEQGSQQQLELLRNRNDLGDEIFRRKTLVGVQVAGQLTDSFSGAFSSILSGQKSAGKAFEDVWKGIAQTVIDLISQMIAKLIIYNTLAAVFTGGASLAANAAASTASGAAGSILSAFSGGGNHSGGTATRGGIVPFAPIGPELAPDETLSRLRVNETVLTEEQTESVFNRPQTGGNVMIDKIEFNDASDSEKVASEIGDMIQGEFASRLGFGFA